MGGFFKEKRMKGYSYNCRRCGEEVKTREEMKKEIEIELLQIEKRRHELMAQQIDMKIEQLK